MYSRYKLPLRQPSSRVIKRQNSGIDVEPLSDIKIVRSIVSTNGKVKTKEALDEIFTGRIYNNTIELIGMPSSVIIDNTNICIASQIFTKGHVEYANAYDGVKTYEQYYDVKKTVIGDKDKITWLGAPSLVYSYENRKLFKHILENTCIHMIFELSSFNSTACITSQHINEDLKDKKLSYCSRLEQLKTKCNDKNKYRTHATHAYNKNHSLPKFITNFTRVKTELLHEQSVLDKDNEFPQYQRYNELLAYFFPWDIAGIEVGGMGREVVSTLQEALEKRMDKLKEDFNDFLNMEDTELLDLVVDVIEKIKISTDLDKITNSNLFLLSKFILTCDCMITNYTIVDRPHKIKEIITIVLDIVEAPIKLYEYGRTSKKEHFKLTECNNGERTTPFELFEQVDDADTKIISVELSEQQYTDKKIGGRRRAKTRKRKERVNV